MQDGCKISALDFNGECVTLRHKASGEPALTGEEVLDFRGDPAVLQGGKTPHKSNSTGRVYVTIFNNQRREYFPSVFGLVWS